MEQPQNPPNSLRLRLRPVEIMGGAFFTVGLVGFIYVQSEKRATQPRRDTRACEDNAYRLHQLVLDYMKSHDILPAADTARDAFLKMAREIGTDEERSALIQSDGCCCPEAHRLSGGMGYVYVGGGLKTDVIKTHRALVFFCSHLSHQAPKQYSQLMRGVTLLSLKNEKMAGYIDQAVKEGPNGHVGYAPKANERLKAELAERRKRE